MSCQILTKQEGQHHGGSLWPRPGSLGFSSPFKAAAMAVSGSPRGSSRQSRALDPQKLSPTYLSSHSMHDLIEKYSEGTISHPLTPTTWVSHDQCGSFNIKPSSLFFKVQDRKGSLRQAVSGSHGVSLGDAVGHLSHREFAPLSASCPRSLSPQCMALVQAFQDPGVFSQ